MTGNYCHQVYSKQKGKKGARWKKDGLPYNTKEEADKHASIVKESGLYGHYTKIEKDTICKMPRRVNRLFIPGDKVKIIDVDFVSQSPEYMPELIGKTGIVVRGDHFNHPLVEVKFRSKKHPLTYERSELKLLRAGCPSGQRRNPKTGRCVNKKR